MVLAGVIQNHPNRAVPDLRRKLVRRLACHGSILSGVGASGKPGAVHIELPPEVARRFAEDMRAFFAEKVEDIVGLYMHPPAHAVVLSIDEMNRTGFSGGSNS